MNRDVGRRSPAGHIAATVLMLWIQIGSLGVVPAVAQTPSKAPVVRGQEYYEQSRFDEAITLLRDLVDRGALAGTICSRRARSWRART